MVLSQSSHAAAKLPLHKNSVGFQATVEDRETSSMKNQKRYLADLDIFALTANRRFGQASRI